MSSTYVNVPSIGNTGPAGPPGPDGPATSPGGANKQVQFNDSSAFGGSANFTFDKTLNSLTVGPSSTAAGSRSISAGSGTTASGNFGSSCFGLNTTANGQSAFAANNSGVAGGMDSAAFNTSTSASGVSSFSTGNSTVASGQYSHSSGLGSLAHGDNQTVVGQYNVAIGTPASPAAGDEIFTVGNGASNVSRATAFSVLRDGTINLASPLGLVLPEITTPSNPAAGFNKLYFKSDHKLYRLDSAGNEVLIG